MSSTNEESRSTSRRVDPKSQKSAGSRDGNNTASSLQNRKGGKQVVKPQEGTTPNGRNASPQPAPVLLPTPAQESHTPINGFNAAEIAAFLKNGIDAKAQVYKPEGKETVGKSSPWGSKVGAMANGKDFWLEFRKQASALREKEGDRKGG